MLAEKRGDIPRLERDLRAINEHYGLQLESLPGRGQSRVVEHDGQRLLVERGAERLAVYDLGPEHRP